MQWTRVINSTNTPFEIEVLELKGMGVHYGKMVCGQAD